MLSKVFSYVQEALEAPTPHAASMRFFMAARRIGANYIQTRVYRRPTQRLTSAAHWAAGGFILRMSPEKWPGSDAFNYDLARKRAESIREALLARGLAASDVVATGRGKRELLVPTVDGIAEPRNRRVEIVVR